MSGGSWDYFYSRVDEKADECLQSDMPLRRAFGRHLQLVSKAMHDIEWVDSCDYSTGDENAAISAVLGASAAVLELREAVIEAERISARLAEVLEKAVATRPSPVAQLAHLPA